MEATITATQLAKRLSDILNRVQYRQERFIIERNGEPIAEIVPAGPQVGATFGEILEKLKNLPRPDDRFADDLEEIHASQQVIEPPQWPS